MIPYNPQLLLTYHCKFFIGPYFFEGTSKRFQDEFFRNITDNYTTGTIYTDKAEWLASRIPQVYL